jgi:hypothetical protein
MKIVLLALVYHGELNEVPKDPLTEEEFSTFAKRKNNGMYSFSLRFTYFLRKI